MRDGLSLDIPGVIAEKADEMQGLGIAVHPIAVERDAHRVGRCLVGNENAALGIAPANLEAAVMPGVPELGRAQPVVGDPFGNPARRFERDRLRGADGGAQRRGLRGRLQDLAHPPGICGIHRRAACEHADNHQKQRVDGARAILFSPEPGGARLREAAGHQFGSRSMETEALRSPTR